MQTYNKGGKTKGTISPCGYSVCDDLSKDLLARAQDIAEKMGNLICRSNNAATGLCMSRGCILTLKFQCTILYEASKTFFESGFSAQYFWM